MGIFYKKEEDQIRKIAREEAIKVADECFEAYMFTQSVRNGIAKAKKKTTEKSGKKPEVKKSTKKQSK